MILHTAFQEIVTAMGLPALERRNRRRAAAALVLLAGLGAGAVVLLRAPNRAPAPPRLETAARPSPPAAVAPPPPRPLPDGLKQAYSTIQRLQEARDFQRAADLYPELLDALERFWGSGSADSMPYVYNYAVALKLGGRKRESAAVARKGLERWPDSLELQVLQATVRCDLAVSSGSFDPLADASFRRCLEPQMLPRVRGLRVDPAALHAQRADMLLRAGRVKDAEEAIASALAIDPRNLQAREIQGRLLLAVQRPAEALPLLLSVLAERPDPTLELAAGIALLETGKPGPAWDRFSTLLKAPAPGANASPGQGSFRDTLRLKAAKALNELERSKEAAELLLELLLGEPDDAPAVEELATSLASIGASRGASSLRDRFRALQHRESLSRSARQARAAGFPSSVQYYQAEAALETQRVGEAVTLLEAARKASPHASQLHLEAARVRLLLGRADLAEEALGEGWKAARSPLIATELARVAALRGRVEEAERLLRSPREESSARAEPGEDASLDRPAERSFEAALRARAFLELGSLSEAKAAIEAEPASKENDEPTLLCRSEIAILEGRLDHAAEILAGGFQQLPGGNEWAGALRAVLEAARGDSAARGAANEASDPSDLLDEPRVLARARDLGAPGPQPPAGPSRGAWLDRLRSIHARRLAILASMEGRRDGDVVPAWHELLRLYLEAKAARKAREAAGDRVPLRPGGLEEHRALQSALSSPEESVSRLRAIEAALKIAPEDPELKAARAQVSGFLGLTAKPR